MTETLTYRNTQSTDATAIAALVRAAFALQTVATDPPPSALRVTGADIEDHLAQGGGGAVAEIEGIIVGSALWIEKDGGLYIGRIAVDPTARRRGIAHHLLLLAERACRARHLPRLWLETRLPLLDNRRVFASVGFVEVSQHAHPGHTSPTFVRMEKPLTLPS